MFHRVYKGVFYMVHGNRLTREVHLKIEIREPEQHSGRKVDVRMSTKESLLLENQLRLMREAMEKEGKD